jgi:glycosyltransferase involved in cell wall biosynthesis
MIKKKLSIIVPVYNEEKNLKKSFLELRKSLKYSKIKKYEIIFIDDKSTDKSLQILLKIKEKNKKIIKNEKNLGLGASLKKGYSASSGDYITWFPSDNEHPSREIDKLFKIISTDNKIDIVIPYVSNVKERTYFRRVLSTLYILIINILFFKKISYYNGLVIYKKKFLFNAIDKINNSSFSFNAELLLRCLKKTNKFIEIPYKIKRKAEKKTSAINIKNLILIIYYIFRLRLTI